MDKTIVYVGNFKFPNKNAAGKRVLGNCSLFQLLGYKAVCIGQGDGTDVEYAGIICHTIASSNIDRVLQNGAKRVISLLEEEKKSNMVIAVVLYGAIFIQKDNLAIVRWCRRNNIKVYYDHVDWLEKKSSNLLRATVRKCNELVLLTRVFPQCNGIICISKYLHEYHKKYGRKTVIIPPLTTTKAEYFAPRITGSELNFVYAGTAIESGRPTGEWKDRLDIMFESLADAADRNSNRLFHLDVYGMTKEQYFCMYPKPFRKYGETTIERLNGNVTFHGLVSNEVAMSGVKNADFSILIRDRKRSTMAGFPTKVSESISCGTPVICTDTSDLREYVVNGYNGFICELADLAAVFDVALKLTDEQLTRMKRNCFDNIFYFSNFRNAMKNFLEEA